MNGSVNHASAEAIADNFERLFMPPLKRSVLENGLTLVHEPDFSRELVSIQVWVRTGSIHEGALAGSGLSHFLEHLLFKGTERRDCKQISREVHALGAEMNAYTAFDRTVYYIDVPSAAFAQAADLLADCVLYSVLPASEMECERAVILHEIDMDLDDTDRRLSQALLQTAFRVHPYREPIIGHRSLFEQVTRDELLKYYHARYVPNNMVVSVVGAVDAEKCLSEIEVAFGQVRRGRLATVFLPEEPTQLSFRREVISGDYTITRGAVGFKVPHLSHSDSLALDFLSYVLGSGESSLLWEQLRNEQRLVNYVDCRNWNSGNCGLFEIAYVCDHKKQSEVEPTILRLVSELVKSGLEKPVLQKVRHQVLRDEINRQKTMSGRAALLGFAEAIVGDVGYRYPYFKRLQSIESKGVQAVAARYLVEERMSSAVLGPEGGTNAVSSLTIKTGSKTKPYEQINFASGARLLLYQEKRLPKVHIRCVLLGGPFYEPANQRGISGLLAELLTKDTANRSAAEISTLVDALGGSFLAEGGNNTINLAIEMLSSHADVAFELLGDALCRPVFEAGTLQTEREAQIAGLKEEEDEIFDYGFRKLREYFFENHPLAVGSDGRHEDLKALTRNDLVAHFNRLVTAPNLVLSVAGDFDRKQVIEHLQHLLESGVRSTSFASDTTPVYKGPAQAVEQAEFMDCEQAVLFQAYPDAGVCDKSHIEGELLNELFNGASSRLFERVREDRGLAYYVGASRMSGMKTGLFTFYAGTHPDQVDEVFAEIDVEIARVKAGQVTEGELQRCRTRLKAARVIDRQTIDAWALHAAIHTAYGLPIESDREYARRLEGVDSQSIAAFAKSFFIDECRVRLVVGP